MNGVSFDFSLDGRYVLNLGSSCTDGPDRVPSRAARSRSTSRTARCASPPDSGGVEVVDFTLPAASGALATNAASLAYASGLAAHRRRSARGRRGQRRRHQARPRAASTRPTLSIASEPIRNRRHPDRLGGASSSPTRGPLPHARRWAARSLCQKQILLFTLGPIGDGGVLIASATPPQQAINYNLPGTCGLAPSGRNCSLAKSVGRCCHTGFPVGSTCDKVAGTTDQVECDVSIGSLAHDSCCGPVPERHLLRRSWPRDEGLHQRLESRAERLPRGGTSGVNDSPRGRWRRPDGSACERGGRPICRLATRPELLW